MLINFTINWSITVVVAMDKTNHNSERFWAFMLPITTALAIAGSVLAERAASYGELLHESKSMQSWLLISIFMGFFSIVGLRAVLSTAAENQQRRLIGMLGGSTMILFCAYVTYGLYYS